MTGDPGSGVGTSAARCTRFVPDETGFRWGRRVSTGQDWSYKTRIILAESAILAQKRAEKFSHRIIQEPCFPARCQAVDGNVSLLRGHSLPAPRFSSLEEPFEVLDGTHVDSITVTKCSRSWINQI